MEFSFAIAERSGACALVPPAVGPAAPAIGRRHPSTAADPTTGSTENMDKPATFSLGISASIAYKGHGVHGGDTDQWSFSNLRPLLFQQGPNGVEMEGEFRGGSPASRSTASRSNTRYFAAAGCGTRDTRPTVSITKPRKESDVLPKKHCSQPSARNHSNIRLKEQ